MLLTFLVPVIINFSINRSSCNTFLVPHRSISEKIIRRDT